MIQELRVSIRGYTVAMANLVVKENGHNFLRNNWAVILNQI